MALDVKEHSKNGHENDISQLIKVLWQGKIIIIICTVVFMIIGIAYAFMAQQWWTSSAIITKGQYQDTASLRKSLTNIYTALSVSNNSIKQINEITSSDMLLNEFVTEFNSYNNKKEFFLKNSIMIQYARDSKISGKNQESQYTDLWAGRVSASLADEKKPDTYTLTYQAKSAKQSSELLADYIHFINLKVRQEVVGALDATISHQASLLEAELQSLEERAKQKILIETKKTQYSLDIAKAANVNQPIAQMDSRHLFSIDLGANGLAEQELLLKSTKDLSLFEPEIGFVSLKIDLINKINLSNNLKFGVVRFLQNVDYPVSRDKPKRSFIILLSCIIGIIIGSGITLVNEMFLSKTD
ncbi:Wzz/FepE/Etk N-terminal domain-containing protein [Photobacterium damselae]